ncbi:MAG: hypothetical protein JO250_13790 [Armatimonadetes bacterium]|nr:hypothetical protein [Armatimonadota bacterium]
MRHFVLPCFARVLSAAALTFACVLPGLAAPASAQSAAAQPAPVQSHKLFLRYHTPSEMLHALGWDSARQATTRKTDAAAPAQAQQRIPLPSGVDHINVNEADNSLMIYATPGGFNQLKEIVRNLDIAPRQVQIRMEFVTASADEVNSLGINFAPVPLASPSPETAGNADVPASPAKALLVSGNVAMQLYQALTKRPGRIVAAPVITDTNGVPASVDFFVSSQKGVQADNAIKIIPRINADDTVTLTLTLPSPWSTGPATASAAPFTTTQTIRSGQTTALALPYSAAKSGAKRTGRNDTLQIIFVSPTIIDTDNSPKTPPAH